MFGPIAMLPFRETRTDRGVARDGVRDGGGPRLRPKLERRGVCCCRGVRRACAGADCCCDGGARCGC